MNRKLFIYNLASKLAYILCLGELAINIHIAI
jgi:hypothetical protein